MTRTLLWLLLSACTISVSAQQNRPAAKLSPLTRQYLSKSRPLADGQYLPGYVYKPGSDNTMYLAAMIKVNNDISLTDLKALGVSIGTKAGNIWTARIPVNQVNAFVQLKGIDYIQLDEPLSQTMDSVRRTTRVDSAQSGIGLPAIYNGTGVIVGVVDAGFDYGHPLLWDTTGSHYRVKRVWEQKTAGTPPTGFAYGNEMTDSNAIWADGYDNGQSHGTHVTGICAGSGDGSTGNKYRGIAYGADIVMVGITPDKSQWINTGASDMIDGMNYIFTYAQSVSKPAVMNLSWGSPLGPRDGNSLFSQACDNLTGTGKIFVCSAGNNGENKIHVQKKFTAADTIVHSFLTIANSPVGYQTWVDIWGDTAKPFCIQFALYNGTATGDSTGFFCIDDTNKSFFLVSSDGDTCYIDITTSSAEFNDKTRIFVSLNSKTTNKVRFTLKGTDGLVNMWNSFVYNTSGYYGSFGNNTFAWAVNGTTDMTISDIAATRSAVTVGAYASKLTWTNISGTTLSYSTYAARGALVPFSSRGPTADGRIKPDITGPGLTVTSGISSYDTTFEPGGDSYSFVISKSTNPRDNREYTYATLSGTSMSGPAVSGIIAMMLQARPNLDPQQVKDIFAATAIKDLATGNLPATGNNNWGHGKVNAYGALKNIANLNGISQPGHAILECLVYPNPGHGHYTLDYNSPVAELLTIKVYDILGKQVKSLTWNVLPGENTRELVLDMPKGIYLTHIAAQNGETVIKTVVE